MKNQTIEELIEETVLDAIKRNPSFPRIASEKRYLSIILKEDYLENLHDYFSSPKEITFKNVISFDPVGFIDNLIYGEYIIPEKIIDTLLEQKQSSSKIQKKPESSKGTILKSLLDKAIGERLFQHNVLQRSLLKRSLITNSNHSYQCMIEDIISIKQNKEKLKGMINKIKSLSHSADKQLNNSIVAYSKHANDLIPRASNSFLGKILKVYTPYFEIIDNMSANFETAQEITLIYNNIAGKNCNLKRYKLALHEFGVNSVYQKVCDIEAQLLRGLYKKTKSLLKITKEYGEKEVHNDLYQILNSLFHIPKREAIKYEQGYSDLKPPYKQLEELKQIITEKKARLYSLNPEENAISYIKSIMAEYSNKDSLFYNIPKSLRDSNLEIYKTESAKLRYLLLQELFERSLDFAKMMEKNDAQDTSLEKSFLSLADEIISISEERQMHWPRGPYARYLASKGPRAFREFPNLVEVAERSYSKYPCKFKK